MAKQIQLSTVGDASVMQLVDVPTPEPGAGEILIQVEAIGLNRAETMYRAGQYIEETLVPGGLGYEAAGHVCAIGQGVAEFEIGDRVSTFSSHSMREYWSYGEVALMPARSARRLPRNMSLRDGASLWNSWLTSYLALVETGQLRTGSTVLIPAAASSTGLAALQIAKLAGCKTIATCRRREKKDVLLTLGADEVIVTDEEEFLTRCLTMTDGRGFDLAFDPIGGAFTETIFDAAARDSTIIVYGAITGTSFQTPIFPLLSKSLTVKGFTIFDYAGHPDFGIPPVLSVLERGVRFLTDGFDAGKLKTTVEETPFSLDQMPEAHRFMDAGKQVGKIVVSI